MMLTKEEYAKRRQKLIDKHEAQKRKTQANKRRLNKEWHQRRAEQRKHPIIVKHITKNMQCVFSFLCDCKGEIEGHHIHVLELEQIGYYPKPRQKPKPKGRLSEKMPLCQKHHRQFQILYRNPELLSVILFDLFDKKELASRLFQIM